MCLPEKEGEGNGRNVEENQENEEEEEVALRKHLTELEKKKTVVSQTWQYEYTSPHV